MTAIKDRNQLENLKKQLDWSETKMSELFFPVLEQKNVLINPLDDENDILTGKKTLYRVKDNKAIIISTMGVGYNVVPNEVLHKAILKIDSTLKLNLKYSRNITNKKFYLIYDMNGKVEIEDKDGDGSLFLKLIVKNSLDGSCPVEFTIGIVREVCLNGLTVEAGQRYVLRKKHTGTLMIEKEIQKFMAEAMSDENIQRIKAKIQENKQKEMTLPLSLLKEMPINQSLPILQGLIKYSTEKVKIVLGKETFLLDKIGIERVIKELSGKMKTDKGKKKFKTQISLAKSLEYNERISNQWMLYNFILKILQFKVMQKNRWEVSKKLVKLL